MLFCNSCKNKIQEPPDLAFYHWQSTFNLTATEKNYLQDINATKIYLRLFDIGWDAQRKAVTPLGVLSAAHQIPDSIAYIPTLFITNETMIKISDEAIAPLADRILKKIKTLTEAYELPAFESIQLDCDWSPKSKNKYFALLTILKEKLVKDQIQLSATIRLHQIKYFKETGVPPVDRGILMCYNTGDLNDVNTQNSILDLAEAEKYFTNFEVYPLPLDLALPIFAWTVVYRDGQFVKLINNLRKETLETDERFIKIKTNQYQLVKSTYLQGYYLYKDDLLRTEAIDKALLLKLSEKLSKHFNNQPQKFTLSFYHLDSATINHFTYEQVQHTYQQFVE